MKTVTALLTLLAAAPACAQDEFVGARLREWYARLNGDVFAQEEGFPAQTIDLDSELGLGDAEFAHELQAYLRLPVIGIFTLGGWTTGYKGDEMLSETFTFGDVTFTAGTQVKTELELSVVYLNYEYDFSFSLGELVKLEVGPLVGVRWMFARTSIESSLVSAEEEGSGGLPVVGVHSALQITRWLRADAEVLGLAFQAAERGAFYIEAYGEVVGQLGPLFAGVGYKYAQLEIEDHSTSVEFEADITMDGIYLTAGVRF